MTLGRGELTLTYKSLCFVNWDSLDDKFEFVSGDKVCRVHSIVAEFLSPKISRQRKCDPLCDTYTFSSDTSDLFDVLEMLVLSIRSGVAFELDGSNFSALFRLSQELENGELLSSLLGIIMSDSLSFEDAIVLLRAGVDLGSAFSDRLRALRDGVASRFFDIKKDILDTLDIETSQLLLSSPSLKIDDEDSLYDFVRSRSENDVRFMSLFEFIQFEYLSVDRVEDFASFTQEFLLENMNSRIWTRICDRLIQEVKYKDNPRCATLPRAEFVCDKSNPLDGIIAHLTRECGGNVHEKGIVKVSASSFIDHAYHPKNVVDLGTDSEYWGDDDDMAWICYDFKGRRVIPKAYSLRSGSHNHLCSWVIEVSSDGIRWTEVDRHGNTDDLNSTNVTCTFTIPDVPDESVQFVRLRMTGPPHRHLTSISTPHYRSQRWDTEIYCILTSFEIFGTLCEK